MWWWFCRSSGRGSCRSVYCHQPRGMSCNEGYTGLAEDPVSVEVGALVPVDGLTP